jgi:hypothetical protein
VFSTSTRDQVVKKSPGGELAHWGALSAIIPNPLHPFRQWKEISLYIDFVVRGKARRVKPEMMLPFYAYWAQIRAPL